MNLTQQIYAQALVLIRDLEDKDRPILEVLCRCSEVTLLKKMRPGVSIGDCKADFVAAAALYAVSAMTEIDGGLKPEQIVAGDLTLRHSGSDAAACCLRYQAEMMMSPYMMDDFMFVGV